MRQCCVYALKAALLIDSDESSDRDEVATIEAIQREANWWSQSSI